MRLQSEIVMEEIADEIDSIREWLDILQALAESDAQRIDPDVMQECRRQFKCIEGGAA